jgi:formyl-CoA transferase
VNTLDRVFESDQVAAREMKIALRSEAANADVPMIGNPIRFSRTPVSYRRAPPVFGEHTAEVLAALASDEG